MKRCIMLMVAGLLISGLMYHDSPACTSFQLNHKGRIFVGKNLDWIVQDGLIIVNKRGVSKTAMESIGSNEGIGQPASWISRYGSITFNQYGRENPGGGMNEVGLVIESMGLFEKGKYPEPDSRPSVLMNQWMQYQLDKSASVKEVLASDAQVRIRPKQGVQIHYLVSDKEGNCASIEFIDGQMVCFKNQTMPHKVVTNNIYTDCMEFYKQDKIPEPDRFKSIERFIRTANMLESYEPDGSKSPLDYAFDILKSVSWSATRKQNNLTWVTNTRWSIVYDVNNRHIYFRTFGNQQIRKIDMAAFDFSCGTPVKVLDINARLEGDVTHHFIDYTRQINFDLIRNAYDKTVYLPKFPVEKVDAFSKYPDTTACTD